MEYLLTALNLRFQKVLRLRRPIFEGLQDRGPCKIVGPSKSWGLQDRRAFGKTGSNPHPYVVNNPPKSLYGESETGT
jgi:hypothetical protein